MGRRGPNAAITFLAFPAASYKFSDFINTSQRPIRVRVEKGKSDVCVACIRCRACLLGEMHYYMFYPYITSKARPVLRPSFCPYISRTLPTLQPLLVLCFAARAACTVMRLKEGCLQHFASASHSVLWLLPVHQDCLILQFLICHSKKCYRPCTSSCHKE